MKKVLTILLLIMIIVTSFQITSLYARYKNELNYDYNTILGKWLITVNDQNIVALDAEKDISGAVKVDIKDSIFYENSKNVTGGISPGTNAYILIRIDPSVTTHDEETGIDTKEYCDVAFKYTIDVKNYIVDNAVGLQVVDVEEYFYNTEEEKTDVENYMKTYNPSLKEKIKDLKKPDNDSITYPGGASAGEIENKYISYFPIDKIEAGYKSMIRLNVKCDDFDLDSLDSEDQDDIVIGEDGEILLELSTGVLINFEQYFGEGLE